MIRLTPRDEAIIDFLNEVKVADTQTLCNIFFNGKVIFTNNSNKDFSVFININLYLFPVGKCACGSVHCKTSINFELLQIVKFL